MIDNKVVGQAISQLRQAENMTQQTLAACLNVSHQAVSKWENGAALPDVLTLLEITKLFGVTLEQLLSGDISNSLNRKGVETEETHRIELKLDGNGLSDRVNKALNEDEDEDEDEEEDEKPNEEEAPEGTEPINIDKIIEMAPFMSRQALDEMLAKYKGSITPQQLSKLAPFLASETLEKLIVTSGGEINWDTLRRLAPFLKKNVVDSLTIAVAKGEKYLKPAAKTIQKSAEELGKQITKGFSKFAKSFNVQFNDTTDVSSKKSEPAPEQEKTEAKPDVKRASSARANIFKRALADGKFEWISSHIDQLDDEEIKQQIIDKARAEGMTDWLHETFGDELNIEDAILSGDWDYIKEHADEISGDEAAMVITMAISEKVWDVIDSIIDEIDLDGEDDAKKQLVEAALSEGQWELLENILDEIDIDGETAKSVVMAAVKEDKWETAISLISELEDANIALQAAMIAIAKGDFENVKALAEEYDDEEFIDKLCECLVSANNLSLAVEIAEHASQETVVALIEKATEAGDWDAIDALNELLD